MYHHWLDMRARDRFLPICGRSRFSHSNVIGLSLYVTIFKNIDFFYIYMSEFLLVSIELKIAVSVKQFLDGAYLLLYQAVCINIFCEI
jgi:hypothetical protein